MTGNVLLIGFAAAGAAGFSMAASLCALGAFLVGAVVGGRLARHVRPVRNLLLVAMVIEAACTTSAAVIAGTVPAIGSGWPRYVVLALLAGAVGLRNAAVRRLGVPDMSTTVLTSTLTGMASRSRLAGGTNPHAAARHHLGGEHVRWRAGGRRPGDPCGLDLGPRDCCRRCGDDSDLLLPLGPDRAWPGSVGDRRDRGRARQNAAESAALGLKRHDTTPHRHHPRQSHAAEVAVAVIRDLHEVRRIR